MMVTSLFQSNFIAGRLEAIGSQIKWTKKRKTSNCFMQQGLTVVRHCQENQVVKLQKSFCAARAAEPSA